MVADLVKLLAWAYVGLVLLGLPFHATTYFWQVEGSRRSFFSRRFWFGRVLIYDLPREDQPQDEEITRRLCFPFLILGVVVCFIPALAAVLLLGIPGYWRALAGVLALCFLVTPFLASWAMYYFERVFRFTYVFWSWIILLFALVAYDTHTSFVGLSRTMPDWRLLGHQLHSLGPLSIAIIAVTWKRFLSDSRDFQQSVTSKCDQLGLLEKVNLVDWGVWMRRCSDVGGLYSILLIIFNFAY